jgi:hypothetical protein
MIDAAHLCEMPGYLQYRPQGHWTMGDLTNALREMLSECLERRAKKLLVDVRQLTHAPVDTFDRFGFGDELSTFWDHSIRLSLVARPDQIDFERFGILVARNRGLVTSIFEGEAEALEWLHSPSADEQH